MNLGRDNYPELRDAVRQLCDGFDSAYWQKIDEQRAYPEAFVEALTKAGTAIVKSQVRLPNGPLKTVGEFPVSVAPHTDVVAEVTVKVVAEVE